MCAVIHESQCVHWLLQRGEPPAFARQAAGWWPDVPAFLFLGMDAALRDFYLEANIAGLWQRVRPDYDAEIVRYQDLLEPSLQTTLAYLRLSEPTTGRVVMLPNLMDVYWRGYGQAVGETSYIVAGPAEQPNISLLQHEFMHPIINPLVDAHLEAVEAFQASRLFAALKEGVGPGYGSWEGMLHENVIRAISIRLAEPAERDWLLRKEEGHGFWLVRPLALQLEVYEQGNLAMPEYMPSLLASLNDLEAASLSSAP
jgi:hypothetical protein